MVGTDKQAIDNLRALTRDDEMTDLDYQILGGRSVRIVIWLDRPTLFRSYIPDQLRAVATEIETASRHSEWPVRAVVGEVRSAFQKTARRIKTKSGRDGERRARSIK